MNSVFIYRPQNVFTDINTKLRQIVDLNYNNDIAEHISICHNYQYDKRNFTRNFDLYALNCFTYPQISYFFVGYNYLPILIVSVKIAAN